MSLVDDFAQMVPIVESRLAGGWATEGMIVNPAADTLMADTGQLAAGVYDFDLWLYNGGDAFESYHCSHRNAANDANVKDHVNTLPTIGQYAGPWAKSYLIETNERFRVTNFNAVVGSVQASIFWVRRA